MKKQLVIIGNGSAAIECYWLAKKMIEADEDLEIKGFLSYEGYKGQLEDLSSLQLGVDDDYEIQQDDIFCIGIGFSELRMKAYKKWKAKGARFINLIHPKCEFLGNCSLGEANIFMGNVFVSSKTTIGNANYFSGNVIISHDAIIGDANFLYPYSIILEFCKIGSNNQLGVYSVMLPKTQIGSNNIIEEEAYIQQDFGDNNRLAGKPATKIGSSDSPNPNKLKENDASKRAVEIWENTTTASDIYIDYNQFLEYSKDLSSAELKKYLQKQIEQNLDLNIDKAMLFFNEYELEFGTETDYHKNIEPKLEAKYNQTLIRYGRLDCKLLDHSIKNINFNINKFKNAHQNERCFIIGNGPSLNKIDLTKLKNEITFGVNSIFLNFDKMGFQTTYYVVEDTHVLKERTSQIARIDKSVKFIPQYARKFIKPDNNSIYYNCIPDYRRYNGYPLFGLDANQRLWCGGTVSYLNIQLALYMGFSEVYLIGFDHHYVIPESAKVNKFDIVSTQDDPNHFHPDYFGKGFSWHIPLVNRMELGYIKAKRVYDKKGVKIFNATPGGNLNVFPRVDYNTLFKG